MDERADRAMVVREPFATGWIGRRVEAVGRRLRVGERARAHRRQRDVVEMYVAERNRELKRQRKQRQIRTQSRTRPEPVHRRQLRASWSGQNHSTAPFENFSNNVTLRKSGRVAIYLVCCQKTPRAMGGGWRTAIGSLV